MTISGARWRVAGVLACCFAITVVYAFFLPQLFDAEVMAIALPLILLGICGAMTDYLPASERVRWAAAMVCLALLPMVAAGKWAVLRMRYGDHVDDVLTHVRLLVDYAEFALGLLAVSAMRAMHRVLY